MAREPTFAKRINRIRQSALNHPQAYGLPKVYPPRATALTDVDLELAEGEIRALGGMNGAGKHPQQDSCG